MWEYVPRKPLRCPVPLLVKYSVYSFQSQILGADSSVITSQKCQTVLYKKQGVAQLKMFGVSQDIKAECMGGVI